jgi:hypothetical protein
MTVLCFKSNEHIVHIKDEPTLVYQDIPSAGLNLYKTRYLLGESQFKSTTAYSIHYSESDVLHACLLLASGGSTTVHARSVVLHDTQCIIAVSSFLVCLQLPDLSLLWQTEVDMAACFGVYHLPPYESYLSHGELEIARVSYRGEILWSSGGKDIFTNGLTLYDNHVNVLDFNNEKYRIDLLTGHSRIVMS